VLIRWASVYSCVVLALLAASEGCRRGGEADQAPTTTAIDGAGKALEPGGSQRQSVNPANADLSHPVVIIETDLGKITLQLEAEKSPGTVSNFLAYVDAGHYDQTIVHQVYQGQGFLAGGYGTNLVERPGNRMKIRNEAENGLKNSRGTVAMARLPDDIDSAACQFFVNVVDNPTLDHKDRTTEGYGYCVFGKVTDGLDVVDKIAAAEVHNTPELECTPVKAIVVKSIRRSQ
jgi:cyclophilin family peptidyl-prolyl cis-trans isomerase